jgi:glutamyl-tRNA reductase
VSDPAPGAIVAFVTHARDVPAVERERLATRLASQLGETALVLETCHRVEAYTIWPDDPERLALAVSLPPGARVLTGEVAVRHALAVAVGRDSVVIGEDQVLHQLRTSVDAARKADRLDAALERLFALALQAGRRARSWRQDPGRSLADVALSAIERQAGSLRGREVLVVGAGRMGRLAAKAAAAAGTSVSVANRSADGARSVATTTGARIEPFDPHLRAGAFAGIIVALGGPWTIGAETIEALAASSTIVVDLSVPVAVPDGVAAALGLRFVSADALALGEHEPSLQGSSLARLDALVDRTSLEFLDWLEGRQGRAAAQALIRRADREREAELEALWRRLPDLQPETRAAIEGMTRHLAQRLLRQPLERLGRDSSGSDERAVRDIFAL